MRKKQYLALLILLALLISSVAGYTVAKYVKTFSGKGSVTFEAKLADGMTITSDTEKVIPGYDEAFVTYTVNIVKKTEIPATLTVTIVNNARDAALSEELLVAVDTDRLGACNTVTDGEQSVVSWTATSNGKETTFTYYNDKLTAQKADVSIELKVPLKVSQYVKGISPTDDTFTVSAKLEEYVAPATP